MDLSSGAKYKQKVSPELRRMGGSHGSKTLKDLDASESAFHCLRHSAVAMLKASGLSDVFEREIVGHESAAV